MSNLFLVLLLVSLVALIVGLIKPSLLKQPSRARAGLIFGGAFVLFFVLFGITSPKSSTPVSAVSATNEQPASSTPVVASTQPTPTAPATAAPAAPQTLAQKIATYAPKIYGTGISYTGTTNDDTGLSITLNVSNIVGPATFRNKTGLLASKIFQDAFAANPSAPEINVLFAGEKVDQYGNTSTGTLMGYYMTPATFAKFNWSNFDGMTLCDVLRQASNTENAETPNAAYTDGCIIFATNLQ